MAGVIVNLKFPSFGRLKIPQSERVEVWDQAGSVRRRALGRTWLRAGVVVDGCGAPRGELVQMPVRSAVGFVPAHRYMGGPPAKVDLAVCSGPFRIKITVSGPSESSRAMRRDYAEYRDLL